MIKVVFWGTPDFSVPTLKMLHEREDIEVAAVVSNPDRKSGRGQKVNSPPVIQFCKENEIKFFQTENINKDEKIIAKVSELNPDVFIVLAFSQFLNDAILMIPSKGSFNIHTSLLPKYRGAAPIQYALLNGDQSTGVSIQKMVKKMDAGDVCHSFPVTIEANETGGELYNKLRKQAAKSCSIFIDELKQDKLIFTPQDESQVSFAPTLKKNDGFLSFKDQNFEQISNRIRALDPWPGTFVFLNDKRLKVFKIEPSNEKLAPGEVSSRFQTLNIGCIDGAVRLIKIQLEGKKPTTDTDLLNGIRGDLNLRFKDE